VTGSPPADARIRVLVADDHPVFRDGIAGVLRAHPELELVGSAGDGTAALGEIRRLEPDVALVDLRLPDRNGIEIAEALERDGAPTRVIIVSAFEDGPTVYRAIAAGARAYLLKVVPGDEICETIVAVARGETVIPRSLQSGLAQQLRAQRATGGEERALTTRELDVLELAADGLSTREIADRLFLSSTTVKTHLEHIYEKLGVSSRAAAVALALRRGDLV
jgi:two-component system nitrate/nitrite response regulator NarL